LKNLKQDLRQQWALHFKTHLGIVMKIGIYDNRDENSKRKLYAVLKDLPEGEYRYEIKKNKPVRSISHNRYYRIVLQCIAGYSGHTEDHLHEYYKKRFNSFELLGEVIGESTSNLDSTEFNLYIKKVKEHAIEFFGCRFLEPQDKDYAMWEQMTKQSYNAMFLAS
jgi:hypothetical protein